MKSKRIYKKMYSRPITLPAIDTYYHGESGIKRLVDGRLHFSPLFISAKGRGVDIYYDINNPDTEDLPMVEYFVKHPKKFEQLEKKYLHECNELTKLSKKPSAKNFSKLRKLLESAQSALTLTVIIGRQYGRIKSPAVTSAYRLRKRTDRILYRADDALMESAKLLRPEFGEFLDYLTLDEIAAGIKPAKKEIVARQAGYIYFEGSVYAGKTVKWLERVKILKLISDEPEINNHNINEIKGFSAMKG